MLRIGAELAILPTARALLSVGRQQLEGLGLAGLQHELRDYERLAQVVAQRVQRFVALRRDRQMKLGFEVARFGRSGDTRAQRAQLPPEREIALDAARTMGVERAVEDALALRDDPCRQVLPRLLGGKREHRRDRGE